MGQPEKENIFGLAFVPSFLNDKPNKWVYYKQKNQKKVKQENGRNNKNVSNSNHNYASQNFDIINDALGGNNSNENCALQNFDFINDELKENNSNDNYDSQNFDNNDVLMGNNSNDNCASQNFDTINYALKGNNSNEEQIELIKDLDEDYKKNSNFNGNKKKHISSNIVNNSTKKVTEESSFQKVGEELNQNCFDNNFDIGKNEEDNLNSFHLEYNTSFDKFV